MSDLEARIVKAISWKKLPFGGVSDLHIHLDANASHAVANLLAPVIRKAQAEAWDAGWDKGWVNAWDNAQSTSSNVVTSPNPYGSNDE